jgi:hypothetical protein
MEFKPGKEDEEAPQKMQGIVQKMKERGITGQVGKVNALSHKSLCVLVEPNSGAEKDRGDDEEDLGGSCFKASSYADAALKVLIGLVNGAGRGTNKRKPNGSSSSRSPSKRRD